MSSPKPAMPTRWRESLPDAPDAAPTVRVPAILTWLAVPAMLLLTHCPEEARRGIGEACDANAQCFSGFCYGEQCLNPDGDDDGDGLTNAFEAGLGSDPFSDDSDGDGVRDGDELDAGGVARDSDADGTPDILESRVTDADGDCLVDELDPDATPSEDLSPMIPLVCRTAGLCAGPDAGLAVRCEANAEAVCDYSGVAGYADPEVSCDGRDENCDGRADEAWPDTDGDGNGNCEPARKLQSWVAPHGSGGGSISDGKYNATLVIGPPILGEGSANGVTVKVGAQALPSASNTEGRE